MVPADVRTSGWLRIWSVVALGAAVAATAADAILLQQSRSYFTGGFLAADHLTGAVEATVFIVTSLAIDLAALAAATLLVLWALSRTRFPGITVALGAGLLALMPVAVANVVEYQIASYLSDSLDVPLLFELAGSNAGEVVAVAWPQMLKLGLLAATACAAVAAILWWRPRAGRVLPVGRVPLDPAEGDSAPDPPAPVRLAYVLALAACLVGAGAVLTVLARTAGDTLDNGVRRKPTARLLGALGNVVTDVDRDGFGLLGRPPDPALFDWNVRPYAREIPGNGIDENGVGGDLPADAHAEVEDTAPRQGWTLKRDVVLIVLESFRADAFGARVGGTPVTPVLDALAASGVSSTRAYSHNGYTVQSRRHIFSGQVAFRGRETLVDDFKANGYETAYFSAQDESFGGAGQDVGFDRVDVAYDARADRDRRYSTFSTAGSLAVSHDVLNERVDEFLRRRSRRPLFLYVNFHDTHYPYHHRDIETVVSPVVIGQEQIAATRQQELREMYLNTAANVDRAIGRLLASARTALGHDPGVIVLSDHGESLFEEGFLGHGYALNDAQTRIPMIAAGLPLVVREPFGQADLRGMINRALASGNGPAMTPVKRVDEHKRVFQYLGNVGRAAQIGFVSGSGRVVFDTRTRRARFDEGAWKRDDELSATQREMVLELIHTWERMLLASG